MLWTESTAFSNAPSHLSSSTRSAIPPKASLDSRRYAISDWKNHDSHRRKYRSVFGICIDRSSLSIDMIGIGRETVKQLLLHGAKVYHGTLSETKAQEAVDGLIKETGDNEVHFLKMDLADPPTLEVAANEFMRSVDKYLSF